MPSSSPERSRRSSREPKGKEKAKEESSSTATRWLKAARGRGRSKPREQAEAAGASHTSGTCSAPTAPTGSLSGASTPVYDTLTSSISSPFLQRPSKEFAVRKYASDPSVTKDVRKYASDPSATKASPPGSYVRQSSPKLSGKEASHPSAAPRFSSKKLAAAGQPAASGQPAEGQTAARSPEETPSQLPQVLSIARPVEDFIVAGLLPVPHRDTVRGGLALLQVQSTETIGSVINQLHRWKISSCIVAFADGRMEFFDCMDFSSYLLEEFAGGARDSTATVESATGHEDWEEAKRKLRRIAAAPVQDCLRPPRGSVSSFSRLDASESLEKLLPLLRLHRRVAVYRGGELCRVVTASDVLEMCCQLSEDTKSLLEVTRLADLIPRAPSMVSKLEISEDACLLEVLRLMRGADVRVVPVLDSSARGPECPSPGTGGLRTSTESRGSAIEDPCAAPGQSLVGQFDIAALRTMFARDHPNGDAEGPWWWEDASITSNILVEPCMDFLALGPRRLFLSTAKSQPAYAAVLVEEPLARAVMRSLSSSYQSVVVHQTRRGGATTGPKPVEGLVSSLGLVLAMLEAGIFQTLWFDPSKPRRDASLKRGHTLTPEAEVPPQAQVAPSSGAGPNGSVRAKVKFNSTIELDHLDVPTCPEHAIHFMRFFKDDDKPFTMDFRVLKDSASDARVVGASAQCMSCQRIVGRIAPRETLPDRSSSGSPSRPSTGSIFDIQALSSFLPDKAMSPFMKRVQNGGQTSAHNKLHGVLKASTLVTTVKKNRASRQLERRSAGGSVRLPDESTEAVPRIPSHESSSLLGMCCVCHCSNPKDRIALKGSSEGYRREDAGGGDPAAGAGKVSRANTTNKPHKPRAKGAGA